jgi:hypothetical protein
LKLQQDGNGDGDENAAVDDVGVMPWPPMIMCSSEDDTLLQVHPLDPFWR